MKKFYLFLTCLSLIAFNSYGCSNSSAEKIENTTSILISYGVNSYAAVITDKEEVKKLEKLFNDAEYTKADKSIEHPYLVIAFSAKNPISYYLDNKDVIKKMDGSYVKSKQISFAQIYSIYNNYSSQKK